MTTAVILMNLGTPAAPEAGAIRRYLRSFLSDRRVVEVPRPIWWPVLYGAILPFRPRKVALGYQMMWREYGDSPLRVISRRLSAAVHEALANLLGEQAPMVELAMTYGEPALADVVARLQSLGADQILVVPLYPQYSATTTGSVYDQVGHIARRARDIPPLTVIKQYCDHPHYIDGLAQSVETYWRTHGRGSRLLISFHGIPQRNVDLGDPYFRQCEITSAALAARLGLSSGAWQMSFQSRLGRAQWLTPYTSGTLQQWGAEHLARVDVICPAFAVDCLETLEEIAVENRAVFVAAGGGDYHYIPCLNDSFAQVRLLCALIGEHMPRLSVDARARLTRIESSEVGCAASE